MLGANAVHTDTGVPTSVRAYADFGGHARFGQIACGWRTPPQLTFFVCAAAPISYGLAVRVLQQLTEAKIEYVIKGGRGCATWRAT